MFGHKKETMRRKMELSQIPDYKQTFESIISQLTEAGFRIQTDRPKGCEPEPTIYLEDQRLGILESDDNNNWEIVAETEAGYRLFEQAPLSNCTIWAWYGDGPAIAEAAVNGLTKFQA